jgi:hypothetical protein
MRSVPRSITRGAFTREELLRARQPHRLPRADVRHLQARLELAGTHAHEGDAVPMPWIHVRLDLEDEAREPAVGRIHQAGGRFARGRWRRKLDKLAQKGLDAEVGERAREKHRRQRPGQHRLVAERVSGLVEQRDIVYQAIVRLGPQQVADRRVVERAGLHLGAAGPMILTALEAIDLLAPTVIHADERAIGVDRPGHGMAVDAEVRLHVAHQLERILAYAVALVDDGEDRHPPTLADREQLAGALLDPLAVVEQHHRAVGGDQHPIRVLGKILVARRIEKVDLIAIVVELHHARRHRDAALLLHLHPVRGGMALLAARLYRARKMNRPAVQQELFRERRLARVGVTDDRECSACPNGVEECRIDGHTGNLKGGPHPLWPMSCYR